MKQHLLKIGIWLVLCLSLAAVFLINRQESAAVHAADTLLSSRAQKTETRCGWWDNPTPSNVWFYDKDGEWTVSIQGGYQAEGDWAEFKANQWVETNGSYGYGCTCMDVTTDKAARNILTIKNARARPLSACRKDKKLKEPK